MPAGRVTPCAPGRLGTSGGQGTARPTHSDSIAEGHAEVARRLRQTPAGKEMLLIALTGYTQSEHIAATREAGFDHHLTKPVDLGSVRRLIACATRSGSPRT